MCQTYNKQNYSNYELQSRYCDICNLLESKGHNFYTSIGILIAVLEIHKRPDEW